MAAKISVIVPVYKVEEYLPRCLKSLEDQTMFIDLEILLVNDGSPDRCGEICDLFAEKHPNVRVIHKQNGGQGSARNAALDVATGEYFAFLDSDDYVVNDIYERLYRTAQESGGDIVAFRSSVVYDDNGVAPAPKGEVRLIRGNSDIFGVLAERRFGFSELIWDKFYRREIFEEQCFPLGMKCEDTFILPSLLSRAEIMVMLPDYLYFYRQRSTSTMHLRGDTMGDNRITAHEEIVRIARDKYPEHLNAAKARTYFVRISCLNAILDCPRFRCHPSWKGQIRDFRRLLPDLLKTKDRRSLPWRRKVYAFFLAYFTDLALIYERIRFLEKRRLLTYVNTRPRE